MNKKKQITKYLKKAVLAQVDRCIDFKNDEFYKINKEDFFNGTIDPNITLKLFENNRIENSKDKNNKKYQKDVEKVDENLYVIIAVKVIRTIQEGSQKVDENSEDLTGIYFIPAMLNKNKSCLLPSIEDNKLPWFPREFLKPIIEPELAIGDNAVYEQTLSDEIYHIYDIFSWEDYIDFCINIYERTTQCEFDEDYIYNLNYNKEKISLEKNMYIFPDKTINPTYSIKSLYENILSQERALPLYENFISLNEQHTIKLQENITDNRKSHYGQMGGVYGLSNSQRECLNNFNYQVDGEILAIKGPPGTGKTTFIQSIVANEYVKRALQEKPPLLIVASSTNNQAVTNIIESFGKINKQYKNTNLENRWIEKVSSFATYFPSKRKRKKAKEKNFQYTDNKGNFFVADIDNEENIKKSKEKFIAEAKKVFTITNQSNITTYKNCIHGRLKKINELQNNLIDIVDYFTDIGIQDLSEYLNTKHENIKSIESLKINAQKRLEFWDEKYKHLPVIWKILSFTSKYKTKISNRLKMYMDETEIFESDTLDISYIEEYYSKYIQKQNEEIKSIKLLIQKVEQNKTNYEIILDELNAYNVIKQEENKKIITNKDELDIWLDIHTRYISFWLSVHYYEARWLENENILSEKQKGTNYENVLKMYYQRLALITPCMVMTFYMLPKQFEIWDGAKNEYLYNTIDLLIVDEARTSISGNCCLLFCFGEKSYSGWR